MGVRGNNNKTYALWEEISHLRVDVDAPPVQIYKRRDTETSKDVVDRTYQVIIPVPNSKNGVRKSLKTSNRDRAIIKAGDEVVNVRTQIQQGVNLRSTPVSKLVEAFLDHKKTKVRGEWEGKEDAGTKSITKQRFGNIKSKLNNYFVPYIGAKTDSKGLKSKQFQDKWETWRFDNAVGGIQPKQSTIKDEITIIRDLWGWGQRNNFISEQVSKPFDDVNLVPDEKTRRDTWEESEYKVFSRRLREWRKEQEKTDNIVKNLELDETLGQLLVAEGFSSIDDIKDSNTESLIKIEGIEEDTAKELIERAKEFYDKDQEEISKRIKNLGLENELINHKGLTPGMLVTLGEQKILKLSDFADLASDELTGGYDIIKGERIKIKGYLEDFALSKSESDELIMSARNKIYKD